MLSFVKNDLDGHVARTGRGAYRVDVAKPIGKRTLRRPRCSWKNNNINFFFKEMVWRHGLD